MLDILYSECDCEKCSKMCGAPCCGTPEDMNKLIEAGYGKRLMFDDWPDSAPMLKPALKDYEGKAAPWETRTERGCTFWKDGKCELHSLGLKPSQGKLAHHSNTNDQVKKIANYVRESWEEDKSSEVIEKWKQINDPS